MTYRLATPIAIAAAMIATAVLGASIRAQGGAARPDVIILLTDQQRADAFGAAGAQDVHTPSMDRLAREGVMFSRAFVATPQCSPSRAAMLTGRYPHRTGVMGNSGGEGLEGGTAATARPPAGMSPALDRSFATLGSVFGTAGYDTGISASGILVVHSGDYGFETHDTRINDATLAARVRGFADARHGWRAQAPAVGRFLAQPSRHLRRSQGATHRHATSHGHEASLKLVDTLEQKPFPQRHYLEADQGRPFVGADETVWRRYRAFYNGLIETVDREIGLVLEALPRRDLAPITVFSSDHGDLGGAHGLPHKGPVMDEELLRVPLAIAWPGRIRSARSDALVSLIDLLPTLCDLTGAKAPSGVDGLTLRPILELPHRAVRPGRAIWSSAYTTASRPGASRSGWSGRSAGNTRDTRDTATSCDLEKDPGELRNLAREPSAASERSRLARELDDWIRRTDDPFPTLTVTDRSGRVVDTQQAK